MYPELTWVDYSRAMEVPATILDAVVFAPTRIIPFDA